MKLLTRLPSWLKNKYFLTSFGFMAILLFLDKNDIFTQLSRHNELNKLQQTKKYYSTQIEAEKKLVDGLKNDPAALEKFAREKYLMKKDNEELFLVSEKPGTEKN